MSDFSGNWFSRQFKKSMPSDSKHTSDTAPGWTEKGIDLRSKDRHKEAIQCFKKALKLDPDDEDAWLNLALSGDHLGHMKEAVHAYEQYLLLAPPMHIKVIFTVIQRLKALGVDIVSDIYQLNNVSAGTSRSKDKPDPREVRTWENKGRCFSYLGKYDDAIKCYDQALKLDSRCASCWNGKGGILNISGRYEDAILCFDQTLELDPLFATAWNNKGDSLNSLGRREEAIICLDKALELNPRLTLTWCDKARILSSLGRHDEAIRCYDQALIIDTQYAIAWREKALLEEKLEHWQEAERSYRQYLALAAELLPSQIEWARQRLAELEGR